MTTDLVLSPHLATFGISYLAQVGVHKVNFFPKHRQQLVRALPWRPGMEEEGRREADGSDREGSEKSAL